MRTKLNCVWLALLSVVLSAVAADFAGTFKGDELTVTLAASQGQYTGTIQMQDKKFFCTARETEGRLAGTFESERNPFEFTATLQGGTLTLQSGGTSYTLQKQVAAVNPLAKKPAPVNPLARPAADGEQGVQGSSQAAAAKAGVLRFRRVSVTDRADMIGGEAFTFLAPTDWLVDGGLVWRLHPTMPAAVAMRVHPPKGAEQLECFPTVAFSWGGYLPVSGFPQGSIYLGNEVQPPVRDAIAYLKERHLPRTRGNVQAKIVKTEELPKLAEAAREAEPAPPSGGPQMAFTAGRVRMEYELEGKAVEEDLYCVLNSIALPVGNMTIQIADKLYGLRAPKGQLDQATKLCETMIHSTRINLEWFNRYAQLVQTLTQAQMNQIRAAGELSRYISRTSSEISDMMRHSYEQRQASQDRINKNWSQYMRGVDEYHDPVAGRAVELPSGYTQAWVNGQGEYVVTERVDFNPNVELEGNWQKLERKEP
ncbi:MAG: hypothetical protein HYY24_16195 [Verrucomicrobia bacterium]|nr:hypothetical protein [Verrucomicrobiota bacterium]